MLLLTPQHQNLHQQTLFSKTACSALKDVCSLGWRLKIWFDKMTNLTIFHYMFVQTVQGFMHYTQGYTKSIALGYKLFLNMFQLSELHCILVFTIFVQTGSQGVDSVLLRFCTEHSATNLWNTQKPMFYLCSKGILKIISDNEIFI